MNSKKQILKLLKKTIATEEQIVPIYANHCRIFSEFLELDDSTRDRFIDVFTLLRNESRQHRELLNHVFQTIEETL